MKTRILCFIGRLFRKMGFVLFTQKEHRRQVMEGLFARRCAGFLGLRCAEVLPLLRESRSQEGQDLLALTLLGREPGFFVEFGALDGIQNSNTYLLEKTFGWQGILAEPARRFHEDLRRNRACAVDTRCVWRTSHDRMEFGETGPWLGGNTLIDFQALDRKTRRFSARYEVDTVSLNDLLETHGAPPVVDFMSIDTEGSEDEILAGVDFSRLRVRLLVVEHNHVEEKRASIKRRLEAQGLQRLEVGAPSSCDDWYGEPAMAQRLAECAWVSGVDAGR